MPGTSSSRSHTLAPNRLEYRPASSLQGGAGGGGGGGRGAGGTVAAVVLTTIAVVVGLVWARR